ncbi:TPA: hypothetical protein DCE37_03145 [Candidatus Latescibacteria bacterium]|nr:hypothetical protein [Candidatus Latescibacterota bacterium]
MTLPRVSPAEAGLNQDHLDRAGDLLKQAIDAGQISAASLTVSRHGSIGYARGFGKEHPDRDAVHADSIFLLASISKPISVLALVQLIERGRVVLNDPVQTYLPGFVGEHKERVLVRHLLSHTSGMPDMLPENIELRQRHTPMSGFVDAALKTPLLFEPETDFRYQSKGILLASEIVDRAVGKPFRNILQEELFGPLEMNRTALGLGGRAIDETVWCGADAEAEQSDYGPNSPYWRDAGHPWGGVHSTGPDLIRLLETMQQGGGRLFSASAVREMTRDQNGSLRAPWGLGWGFRDSRVWAYFGDLCSARTFGHTGATGTVAWADPETGVCCAVLTNEMVEEVLRRVSNVVASAVS